MITDKKLQLADDIEYLMNLAGDDDLSISGRQRIEDSIATLRSNRTVVLKFREQKEGEFFASPVAIIRKDEEDGSMAWDVANAGTDLMDEMFPRYLIAPLPDLGEITAAQTKGCS